MMTCNGYMAGVLDQAKALITGQRQEDYGTPDENFGRIARLWSAYLNVTIKPHEVAMMMALLKISRIAKGGKLDSFVDLAGYTAIAAALHPYAKADAEETI